jgi:hypothetical protein
MHDTSASRVLVRPQMTRKEWSGIYKEVELMHGCVPAQFREMKEVAEWYEKQAARIRAELDQKSN